MTISFLSIAKFLVPEIVLVFVLLSLIFSEVWSHKFSKRVFTNTTIVGFMLSFIYLLNSYGYGSVELFNEMVIIDRFSILFKSYFLIVGLLIIVSFFKTEEIQEKIKAEFQILIIASVIGMMMTVSAGNLFALFLSIEIVSLINYLIATYDRENKEGGVAAEKYFIYSTLFSILMLLGVAMIFGRTGSLIYSNIREFVLNNPGDPFLLISFVFIFVGLFCKLGVFPFFIWKSDVFAFSPTVFLAFIITGPFVAIFAAMIRFITNVMDVNQFAHHWQELIAIASLTGMFIGSFSVVSETNLKRILAYLTMGNIGFLLLGLLDLSSNSIRAVIFMMIVNMLSVIGTLKIVSSIRDYCKEENIDSLRGMVWKFPFETILLTIFLVALVGMPLTAGFIGKIYLITAIVETKMKLFLPICILFTWAISIYGVFKIIHKLFLDDKDSIVIINPSSVLSTRIEKVVLTIMIVPVIVFGVKWDLLIKLAESSLLYSNW